MKGVLGLSLRSESKLGEGRRCWVCAFDCECINKNRMGKHEDVD